MTSQKEPLILLSGVAIQAAIDGLLPEFEQTHDLKIEAKYDVNPAVPRRVVDGEEVHVGITNPWFFEKMAQEGRVVPDIHVPLARVPLAIGTAGSKPKELIQSYEDVRDLLLNAKSVAYISTGTSGPTFLKALKIMKLDEAIRDRLRPMGQGEPPAAAAAGQVQYAVAPLSRILAAPGLIPVGLFPSELGLNIDMSMFVGAHSGRLEEAKQFIDFLSDGRHDEYLKTKGIHRFSMNSVTAAPSYS